MKINYKIFLAALILSLSFITNTQAKLFGAEEFTLDNGMRVIVIPNHKAPIIKHMVWYKAGSADEELGKGGSAHLLEHLMFRGTKKVRGNEFNNILENNGADSNAFTSLDYTAYHQSLDISKLELAMALEADRMQNLNISQEDFALERDIVFQERMQMVENNPSSPYSESYRRLLWQDSPYGRPVSGTAPEIKSLKLEDVETFYNRFYAPNNAILVLSGDIKVPTAKALAEKYYGPVKPRSLGKKADFPKPNQEIRSELKMALPQIKAERLSRSYIAPSYNTGKDDIYNLAVLSKYLGEGETSELYKALVLQRKLALSVSTGYSPLARGYASFSVSALPAEGVSAQELNNALDEEITKALNKLNIDEVEKNKQKMLAGLVYLKDNPFDAAMIAGTMAAVGMSLNDIENHAENIRRVNYKDVKKAAEHLFNDSARLSGVLSPRKGAK